MSNLQLKAYLINYCISNNIRYMCELRAKLKKLGRYDLLLLLDDEKEFTFKLSRMLFRKRLGVEFYG